MSEPFSKDQANELATVVLANDRRGTPWEDTVAWVQQRIAEAVVDAHPEVVAAGLRVLLKSSRAEVARLHGVLDEMAEDEQQARWERSLSE